MGTLNTRISIRSSNAFKNTITFRHDKAYAVEARVDQGTRVIKDNSSGSPHEIASGSDYFDSSESGALANQVYVFIRNTTLALNKTITVQFNKNGTRDDVGLLGPGQFMFIPWKCDAATDKLEVFSNDTAGVKVEYILSPMR